MRAFVNVLINNLKLIPVYWQLFRPMIIIIHYTQKNGNQLCNHSLLILDIIQKLKIPTMFFFRSYMLQFRPPFHYGIEASFRLCILPYTLHKSSTIFVFCSSRVPIIRQHKWEILLDLSFAFSSIVSSNWMIIMHSAQLEWRTIWSNNKECPTCWS